MTQHSVYCPKKNTQDTTRSKDKLAALETNHEPKTESIIEKHIAPPGATILYWLVPNRNGGLPLRINSGIGFRVERKREKKVTTESNWI